MSESIEFGYDLSRLEGLFRELEPKRQFQALRGGIWKTGREFRKKAVGNFRKSVKTDRELEKQVRLEVYRKKAVGFRVTVGDRRKKGGRKPIARWSETGTAERRRKWRRKRRRKLFGGKGGRTGRMRSYGFMEATKRQESAKVAETLRSNIIKNVERIVKKYGNK